MHVHVFAYVLQQGESWQLPESRAIGDKWESENVVEVINKTLESS